MRFRTRGDNNTQFDGFNFDSLRIVMYDVGAQPAPVAVGLSPAPALEFSPVAPNPIRGEARFAFALPVAGHVRLEVLDLAGRRVRTLVDGTLLARRYAFGWDVRDDAGRAVPPGIYLARLVGEDGERIRRFAILK
jgi:hypothetical protein